MRVGIGFDIHRLISNRKLIIGGITIPYHKGLDGHSDADVLIHAIGDALLGASGKRDIGYHFPDTDPKFKNCSSLLLLQQIIGITHPKIINIDSIIIAEAPRLLPYIEQMIDKIAFSLDIQQAQISIKAKTYELLGDIGKGKAIAAYSVVLIK
ncbi:MAG: 2-C-methyl-D-erythritol 2,4-cyclodiphosphate synthase [Candidatus Stahlbacteria bacterium]|nr:2-C-methyl-D-erythritol 2,4-cyclodiphosphate synthase [Candidatus Stahlbacteria bacterium]